MKKLVIVFIVVCSTSLSAQKVYSLDECINLAVQNSNRVGLARIDMKDASVDVLAAKNNKLPFVDFGIGHGLNFGRSIDPASNDFINEQITRGGFNGGASVTLWQMGRFNAGTKRMQYAEEAARWAVKNEEANLQLQVVLAYLNVLSNKELSIRSSLQEKTTQDQVSRVERMNLNGAVIPSQLYDLQGQLASDKLAVLDNKQNIQASLLVLCQLMNVPFDENMDVKPLDQESNVEGNVLSLARTNLSHHAWMKVSEFQIKSEEMRLKSSKAERYPRLNLNGDIGSNYSSAFTLNGDQVGYGKQLSNNANYAFGLSLGIPILDGYRVRGNIKRSENAIERAKTNAALASTTLQQNVEQAIFLLKNAEERFQFVLQQVNSFAESFRIAETRLNAGAVNSVVEYLIAKNNYDRAQNQLISSKYEKTFRAKIVEFYAKL